MPILGICPLIVKEQDTKLIKVKYPLEVRTGQDEAWSHLGWTPIISMSTRRLAEFESVCSVYNRHNFLYASENTRFVLYNENNTVKPLYKINARTRLYNACFPLDFGSSLDIVCSEPVDMEDYYSQMAQMITQANQISCKNEFLSQRNNLEPFRVLTNDHIDTQYTYMLGEKAGMDILIPRTNHPGEVYFNLNYDNYCTNYDYLGKHTRKEYKKYMNRDYPRHYQIKKFLNHKSGLHYDSHSGEDWEPRVPDGSSLVHYHNDLRSDITDRIDMYFDRENDVLYDFETQNGYYQAGIGKLIIKTE